MSKYPYLGVNELDQSRHAQPCSKKQKATQTVQKPHTLLFTPCIIFTFKSHQQFLHCFAIFLFILFCQSLFLLCFFFFKVHSSSFISFCCFFCCYFFFSWNPEKRALFTPKPRGLPNHTPPFTHTSCANMGVTSILFPATSSFHDALSSPSFPLPPYSLLASLTHTHTQRLLLVLRRKQQLKSDHSSSLCYKFPFSCLILPSFTEKLLKYYSPCPFHTIFSFMFILLNRHQQ